MQSNHPSLLLPKEWGGLLLLALAGTGSLAVLRQLFLSQLPAWQDHLITTSFAVSLILLSTIWLGWQQARRFQRILNDVQKESRANADNLELLRREKWMRERMLESMPAGMAFLDQQHQIHSYNPAFQKIIEQFAIYTPDQAAHKSILDIFPHISPSLTSSLQKVHQTGEACKLQDLELQIPKQGEAPKSVWTFILVPTFDPSGGLTGVLLIADEVTDRWRAAAELRFAAQLLDSVKESVVAADFEGRFVYWGKGTEALLGYSAGEMLGQDISYISPDLAKGSADRIRQINETGSWTGISPFQHRRGHSIWIESTISLARDEQGEPLALVSVGRDVTEKFQAEQELREREAQYSALFRYNHAVMLLGDPETTDIVDANLAALRFYGYSYEEITRLKLSDINNLPVELMRQEMQRAKDQVRNHFFFQHRLASGEIRDVEVYASPIQVKGRTFLYSIVHDITQRRQAEQALQLSEERYRRISELVSDFAYSVRIEMNGAFVPEWGAGALSNVNGVTFFGNPNVPWTENVYPDDVPLLLQSMERLIAGETVEFDFRVLGDQGQTIWLHNFSRPVWNDDQRRVTYLLGAVRNITAAKEAGASLQVSEARFHSVFQDAGIGIALADKNGVIVEINPALAEMLGYAPAELVGVHFVDLTYSDDVVGDQMLAADVVSGKRLSYQLEKRYVHKSGRLVWARLTVSAVRAAKGQIDFVIAMVEDVTVIKQAHEQAERSARELAALYNTSQAIISTLDIDQVLNRVLDEARMLLDAQVASVLLHDEERQELLFAAVSGPAAPQIANVRMPASEGLAGWVFRTGEPLLVLDVQNDPRFYKKFDQVTGMRSHSMVLAPLHYRERTIGVIEAMNHASVPFDQHSVELLSLLAGSAAIAIENARLYRQIANRLAEAQALREVMLASASTLDFDEVLYRTLQAVHTHLGVEYLGLALPAEDGQLVLHASQIGLLATPGANKFIPIDQSLAGQVFLTGQPRLSPDVHSTPGYYQLQAEVVSEVLVPVWSNQRVVAVLGANSTQPNAFGPDDLHMLEVVASQLGILMENSRLYHTEQEQRRLVEQSQVHLLRSAKLSAMGTLVASLAHEINNPLQALRSGLNLLLNHQVSDEKRHQYLEITNREVERLAALVERVLEFNRPTIEERQPVDINDALSDTLTLVSKRMEHAWVTASRNLEQDLPPVYAVPGQLNQVFLNILLNAIQAMPGGGELHIETQWQTASSAALAESLPGTSGEVWILFRDSGEGIAPEALPNLFDPFYTTRPDGTGLGLAVSYNIVAQHNGRIEVNSQLGQGSTFIIRLPALHVGEIYADSGSYSDC